MAKLTKKVNKTTSKRVAGIASKVMRNKRQDKKSKIVAASALSQRATRVAGHVIKQKRGNMSKRKGR